MLVKKGLLEPLSSTNKWVCRKLQSYIRSIISCYEKSWKHHIAMCCFRYNTSVNMATGVTPLQAVFGIEALDFDAKVGRRMKIDDESQYTDELSRRLLSVQDKLLTNNVDSRMDAAKQYNKLVDKCQYDTNDRVVVFIPLHKLEKGRNLFVPCMGPYRVVEPL